MMSKVLFRAVVAVLLAGALPLAAHAKWVWSPEIGRFIRVDRMPEVTAELQIDRVRSYMAAGDYKRALVEADRFEDYFSDTEYADDNQFLRGEIFMAQGKYMAAANAFQQVVTGYPDSDLFDEVIRKQYEVGDLYYAQGQKNLDKGWWRLGKRKPFKKAVKVYTMVIDNQPFSPEAAEAQYKIGLCYFTVEKYVDAAFEYRRVIEDYAGSDWVDDASYGLAMCYDNASLPSEYDQAPSQLAIQSIDEFAERFPQDSRVGDLQARRVEMRERIAQQRLGTARFYDARRKFNAAAIYYRVVAEEFSETAAANEARAWLETNPARNGG